MIDIKYFKNKLEEEKNKLEEELGSVGRVNPDNPADWEPTPEKMDIMNADRNERADAMEEFEARSAVEVELENRLSNIKNALLKMENGKYGICEKCGKEIEQDRLEANPAAATCKEHLRT